MNKYQRIVLAVGLVIVAIVLHFGLCEWTTYQFGAIQIFGNICCVRNVPYLLGLLGGIVVPIILVTVAVLVFPWSSVPWKDWPDT